MFGELVWVQILALKCQDSFLLLKLIKTLASSQTFCQKLKIKILVNDKKDGDILFLIHITILNTDLRFLNFSSKDHNLEEIVNEKRCGSWDNQLV